MASWMDWGATIEGTAAALLAIALLVVGLRRASTFVLSGLLVAFAGMVAAREVPRVLIDLRVIAGPDLPPEAEVGWSIARSLFISLNLAFAVVYPHWSLGALKKGLLAAALTPGLVLALTVATNPSLVMPTTDGTVPFLSRLIALLTAASPLPALWVFGNAWIRTEGGRYRAQFLYILIPYLLWNVNAGLSFLVRTLANPDRFGSALVPVVLAVALAQLVLVARVGVHASARSRAAADPGGGGGDNDDGRLVAWLLVGAAVSPLQFVATGGQLFVDGLVLPVLFYGLAKYQMRAIDLTLKTGLRGSVVAGASIVVLVLIEEVVQFFAGRELGLLAGVGVAVVVAFTFRPLHRAAERFSRHALPHVEANEAYLRQRALDIYGAALSSVLRDRRTDPAESRALAALRTQFRLTLEDHARLQRELAVRPRRFRRAVLVNS